jgi:hypothetical protein
MPITCANEFKLLIDQMSNSQAYSFVFNIFLCSEYIGASLDYATNRQVASSIPDCVIGIFQ